MEQPTQPRGLVITEPLPGLDRVRTANLIAFFSDRTCGESCWSAKEEICRCECGGKNHGITLRGGSGKRAAKINGVRYELVSVGQYQELLKQATQLVLDSDVEAGRRKLIDGEYHSWTNCASEPHWFKTSYVHPTEYNQGGGQYVLKYASLSQCLKWQELAYFGVADDRDRYHSNAAILWKREDVPTYL